MSVGGDDLQPQLLGLHIKRYKNLLDQWIPWSSGVALFGANGVGKTNLLASIRGRLTCVWAGERRGGHGKAFLIGRIGVLEARIRSNQEGTAGEDIAWVGSVRGNV